MTISATIPLARAQGGGFDGLNFMQSWIVRRLAVGSIIWLGPPFHGSKTKGLLKSQVNAAFYRMKDRSHCVRGKCC